jgi:hypothetical protein
MSVTWNVERESDGGFVMGILGTEPRFQARDFLELKEQCYRHQIVDDLYEDVCKQLEKGDRATIKVPIFKFKQVSF